MPTDILTQEMLALQGKSLIKEEVFIVKMQVKDLTAEALQAGFTEIRTYNIVESYSRAYNGTISHSMSVALLSDSQSNSILYLNAKFKDYPSFRQVSERTDMTAEKFYKEITEQRTISIESKIRTDFVNSHDGTVITIESINGLTVMKVSYDTDNHVNAKYAISNVTTIHIVDSCYEMSIEEVFFRNALQKLKQ